MSGRETGLEQEISISSQNFVTWHIRMINCAGHVSFLHPLTPFGLAQRFSPEDTYQSPPVCEARRYSYSMKEKSHADAE
jgi:hypothetical protein